MRAGAHALSLLSVPLNIHILTALADEQRSLMDLRRTVGLPPPTTMRKRLQKLTEAGILDRRRQSEFPGSVDYTLAPAGEELLEVVQILDSWLDEAPDGSLKPGSIGAKSAITALIDGWSSTIIRAIAARPLSLTDLNKVISSLNYPSLERRLGAMRVAGQIRPCLNAGRSRPYTATEWLRLAVAPLTSAAKWERQFLPKASAPISRLDFESVFLLAVPAIQLPADVDGSIRLAAETRKESQANGLAGVLMRVEQGRVISCVSRLEGAADASAVGSSRSWLGAMIDGDLDALEIGGDGPLARVVIERLNEHLFGSGVSA